VGTETERALARGAAPAPAPAPATGPATAITRDNDARRRTPRWPFLLAAAGVAALAFAGRGWLRGLLSPRADATPAPPASSAPAPPAPPSALAPAPASDDAARLAGLETAKESPTVAFAATVFPVGYALGAVDERPVHDVSFPTFFLQIDETTVGQYARCVAVGRCTPAGTGEFCNAGVPGRERNPVNCVSNPQAAAYCAWLGRRLPTEDEWEYAASGKAKRLYAWGNQAPGAGRVCFGRGDAGTCDVASFDAGATPEGLRDMTGDVWEWTSSDYCPYDGSACARDQKVARGGGWFSADPNVVRTQVRQGYAPAVESANVGFRCARSL
jgi:formylglycine-generating enzyme required for sulfatase activity